MKKKLNKKTVYSLISFGTVAAAAAIVTPIVVMNSSNETKEIEIKNEELKGLVSFRGENGSGKKDFDKKIETKNFTLQLNDESKGFEGLWMNGDVAVFDIKPKTGFVLSSKSRKSFAVKVSNLQTRFIKDMDISQPIMDKINGLITKINEKTKNTDHETNLSYNKSNEKNYVLVKDIDHIPNDFINLQIHLSDENDKGANPYINAMIKDNGTTKAFDLTGYKTEKNKKLKSTLNEMHNNFKIDEKEINEIRINMKSVYYTELSIRNFTYDEFWHLFDLTKSAKDNINTGDDIKAKIIKILDLEMKQKAINEKEQIVDDLKTFIDKTNITLIPSENGHKMTIKFSYKTIRDYEKSIDIFDFNYDL